MGNQKQKWTQEEEDALLKGVAKHGPGKWKNILKDPDFSHSLVHRSNIDLKDKWRNLSVSSSGQGSKDKNRAPKIKAIQAAQLSFVQNSGSGISPAQNATLATVADDPSNNTKEPKGALRWHELIFEALSALKDTNRSDIDGIFNYISQRNEMPQNSRKLLGQKLRRLLDQGKLEKVQDCYRITNDTVLGVKTPTPKQKDIRPQNLKTYGSFGSGETLEEVALSAACRIAEAEDKEVVAADAVKEEERVAKMAEETEIMLQLAKEIYERCSRGEIVLLS